MTPPAPQPAPDSDPASTTPLRLFVRARRPHRRPFELWRLDTWGDSLLGTKLRGELSISYLILIVICTFEISAWTLLFNFFLHGGEMRASFATLAAVLLGLLWGMGVFAFDKNLLTADLLRPGWSKYAGMLGRVALVLASARLTAEPIEQQVFRSVIEEHLKQEVVREEAVRYAHKLGELQLRREKLEAVRLEDELPSWVRDAATQRAQQHEQLQQQRGVASTRLREAELAAQRAREQVARARAALTEAARQGDPAIAIAERKLSRAQSAAAAAIDKLDRARAEQSSLEDELTRSATSLSSADAERKETYERRRKELEELQAQVTREEQGYRKFLAQLATMRYGAPVQREDGSELRWKPAGAVERITALAQLRSGVPPRWSSADPQLVRTAAKLAGLGDDGSRASLPHEELLQLWRVVLSVGMAIPALAILYKLFMSRELKLYYSVAAQAAAGNPEAVALQCAAAAVEPSHAPTRSLWRALRERLLPTSLPPRAQQS